MPLSFKKVLLYYWCWLVSFHYSCILWTPRYTKEVLSFGSSCICEFMWCIRRFSPISGLLSDFLSLSSRGVIILKFLCYFGIWFIIGRGLYNNNNGGRRCIRCFICYKSNHISTECPFKNQIDLKFCTNCGVGDHSLEAWIILLKKLISKRSINHLSRVNTNDVVNNSKKKYHGTAKLWAS